MINRINIRHDFEYSLDTTRDGCDSFDAFCTMKCEIEDRLRRLRRFQNITLGRIYHYNQEDGTIEVD